jgi:hypothetical protein
MNQFANSISKVGELTDERTEGEMCARLDGSFPSADQNRQAAKLSPSWSVSSRQIDMPWPESRAISEQRPDTHGRRRRLVRHARRVVERDIQRGQVDQRWKHRAVGEVSGVPRQSLPTAERVRSCR